MFNLGDLKDEDMVMMLSNPKILNRGDLDIYHTPTGLSVKGHMNGPKSVQKLFDQLNKKIKEKQHEHD